MKQLMLTMPMFEFIAGTRVALGLGIGLLVAGRLGPERRRAAGALLVVAGAAATVPALFAVVRGRARARRVLPRDVARDPALIGVTRLPRKGDDDAI
jgi:hypothetical protein